jgi:hypothetical protein
MAPVKNGNNALPTCPNPAIQPIDAVNIQGGKTRDAWFIAMGYIGPRSTPMMETETALPTSEGINQMTSSRLQGLA